MKKTPEAVCYQEQDASSGNSAFSLALAQILPPTKPSVVSKRSRKGVAAKKKEAKRRDLLLEFERETSRWLSSISEFVASEAAMLFVSINSKGRGLPQISATPMQGGEILKAVAQLADKTKFQVFTSLFFHSHIPSLLAAQSRKHSATKARKGASPEPRIYKEKIKELLRRDNNMLTGDVISNLERHEWITEGADGNSWDVATKQTSDGMPEETSRENVKKTSMESIIADIRTTLTGKKKKRKLCTPI